jgi:hypothetical protein
VGVLELSDENGRQVPVVALSSPVWREAPVRTSHYFYAHISRVYDTTIERREPLVFASIVTDRAAVASPGPVAPQLRHQHPGVARGAALIRRPASLLSKLAIQHAKNLDYLFLVIPGENGRGIVARTESASWYVDLPPPI